MPRPSPRPSASRTNSDGLRAVPFAIASLLLLALAFIASGLAPTGSHAAGAQAGGRTLSLEERVAYQRAVEEVNWRHTVWPADNSRQKPTLDEVMPLEATRARVEDTLRKSEALAWLWDRPVTAEQLQAELTRQARETRQPERLRELWGALGDDPFVIAEVLARPALVDRLARNSFDSDAPAASGQATRAGASSATFDSWWEGASQQFAPQTAAGESFAYQLAETNAAADDTWKPTQALPVATGTAVWTGSELVVWGGITTYGGRTNSGSRYNPATDTWSSTSTVGAPLPRAGHVAVWTGTEMIVWGGSLGTTTWGDGGSVSGATNTGGRYNPSTDTWTPTSTNGAPFRSGNVAVWTGSKMIVWGPSSGVANIYDPSTDSWKEASRANTPGTDVGQRAVWTGTEMFIWGGYNTATGKRGGLYNPSTDTWRSPNHFNAPSNRTGFSLVWTGAEAVVWGGFEGNNVTLNTGGRYNPSTDTWTPTSTATAPAARYGHTAVWTGSEMVVYGGDLRPGGQSQLTNTGARYDPLNDSWAATPTANAPVKFSHVAVWTGTEMIAWGGQTVTAVVQREAARYSPSKGTWVLANSNDAPLYLDRGVWTGAEMLVWGQNSLCYMCDSVGARYDPATNVWRPMNLAGAPPAGAKSYGTNAVWTGKEMIVWGGGRGRYNPLTDTWAPVSLTNAPAGGWTAVWSGKEMIVWGSNTQENADAGGRYNPDTDTWRPTSTAGAPAGRYMHTAVWAGSEMVVWGGVQFGVAGKLNTGGRYNPETDTWRPTSTDGAPEGRTYHTAVWTGREMVVWGGSNSLGSGNTSLLNTGGRYDPAADAWTQTSTAGAPEPRSDHRAVWTGTQMIVWGGAAKGVNGPYGTYTGARYNPSTDVWTPTSTLSAPSKRSQHVQVWTGTQMIVWGGQADEGAATHGAVYNAPGASPAGNIPPAVRLSAPAGGTAYQSGDTVQLAAEVSDADGSVTTVRFYANGQLIGRAAQAPFAFNWVEARGGDYALMATATDDAGAESRSAAVNISVAPSTAPPACALVRPAAGSSYDAGSSVVMEVEAVANRDRSIAKVEFLDNGVVVASRDLPTYPPPHVFTYLNPAAGAHALAGRCTDSTGAATTTAVSTVTVGDAGFAVSGQLLDDRGFVITGVRVRLDGPAGTAPRYATTVQNNGNYSFGGLKAGETYTVTPEPGAWRFSPESNTFTAISKSWTGQHFYGTMAGYGISGYLRDAAGNPIYPATVNLSGAKTATTSVGVNGYYFFSNLAPGNTYTVQPYKNLYAFAPNSRTFENLSAEQTADFTGAPQGKTYAVGGRVVDEKGAPVAGLSVRLNTVIVNSTQYRTTDADGRYSFGTVQEGETATVDPQDPTHIYSVTPASRTYYKLAADVADANFVVSRLRYSLRGVVTDGNAAPLYPATVTLTGGTSAAVTTNPDGSYAFDNLMSGGDYTVRPSKDGYNFTPQAATYTALAANQTANFTGTATPVVTPTPTPTPAPTPAAVLTNFALASNGGVATASSTTTQQELPGLDFSPAGAVNGDRKGLNWEHGGGWRDATNDSFPDWLQVDFDGPKSISEVGVFCLQDNYSSPSEPTEAAAFTKYGVSAFDLMYWDGSAWAPVPGGAVVGNDRVWRKLSFQPVTTTKLRLVVRNALAGRSRLVEFEAWGTAAPATPPPPGRLNAALASNGGVATASSTTTQQELPGLDFSPAGVINGDRKGLNWEHGGGWRDATNDSFPDWVQVEFASATAVDEVDVFTLQDNYSSPSEPTEQMTFTRYGVTSFEVQYWDGSAWATVPGGAVTNNGGVWRRLTFPAVTTTRVRVVVHAALAGRSRLVELEAWGVPAAARVNHAASANGGVATASSTTTQQELPGLDFSPAGVINGDRKGLNWEHGGGWRDGTGNAFPDWLEVQFAGARRVDEVNVFSIQDNYASPAEPSAGMTFAKYGVTSFEVQYWDGAAWATVPGGAVTNNNLVWRRVTFPAVTTTKVRVLIQKAADGRSRLAEVEAVGPAQ